MRHQKQAGARGWASCEHLTEDKQCCEGVEGALLVSAPISRESRGL